MKKLYDNDFKIFNLEDMDDDEDLEETEDFEEIEIGDIQANKGTVNEDGFLIADSMDDDFIDDEEYMIDNQYMDEEEYIEDLKLMGGKNKLKTDKEPKSNKKTNPNKKSGNFLAKLFANFTGTDALVASTGVIVLILAIVTVSLWSNGKATEKQVATMSEVGSKLSNLQVVGESGLLAVTDAQIAKQEAIAAANAAIDVDEVVDEDEIINCNVTYTSVEKDLKLKFVNEKTKKLIPDKDFVVELTGPDKKTVTYTDDDHDGIIYKTKMTSGKYKVKILEVEGIEFESTQETVTVKDKIEYQKIDVQDEVKTEAQVNVAKEDTEKEVVQEAVLADTVEYVASTSTPTANASGYSQIDKATVTDPGTLVSAGLAKSLFGYSLFTVSDNEPVVTEPVETVTNITVTASNTTIDAGGTTSLTATVSGNSVAGVVWSSANTSTATVNGSGVVTGASGLSSNTDVKIIATAEFEGKTITGSITITVKAAPVVATYKVTEAKLNATTGSLLVGGTPLTLLATINSSDGTNTKTETSATAGLVSWSSSATTVATVSANGVVTAVGPGTAEITATTVMKGQDGNPVTTGKCIITVTAKSLLLTMEPKLTAYIGKAAFLAANVTKNGTTIKTDGTAATKDYVTWTTSDGNIAKVDSVTGLITPIKAGSVIITATTVDKDASDKKLSVPCTVTVKANPEQDVTNLLKDNAGNQVYYINDDGKYIQATWSDYYKRGAFFIKVTTQYKYTGWQTIDNKTYFFDKNNNAVKGDQIIQGVKYTFTSDGILNMGNGVLGIDVSKWNGTINWTAVKNSGVSFVIIRCGFRGSSSGALIEDLNFKANIQGANAAGLKVGVYFFTQAVNEIEAVQEASMVLSLVKSYKISYPIFIDSEGSGGRGDTISVATRTAATKAFCETIKNGGYTPGIYASKSWFNNQLTVSSLNSYKIWLAQYATKPTYAGKYDLWQYTSSGVIGGINGKVDLNYSYMGY